jgi:hypothetical protein
MYRELGFLLLYRRLTKVIVTFAEVEGDTGADAGTFQAIVFSAIQNATSIDSSRLSLSGAAAAAFRRRRLAGATSSDWTAVVTIQPPTTGAALTSAQLEALLLLAAEPSGPLVSVVSVMPSTTCGNGAAAMRSPPLNREPRDCLNHPCLSHVLALSANTVDGFCKRDGSDKSDWTGLTRRCPSGSNVFNS